jgi:hypothetical protein
MFEIANCDLKRLTRSIHYIFNSCSGNKYAGYSHFYAYFMRYLLRRPRAARNSSVVMAMAYI